MSKRYEREDGAGRIYFRPIEKDDTDNVLKWRNSDSVRKFFIRREIVTKEDHVNWLINMVDSGKVVQFIVHDKENNTPFASVYLKDIDREKCEAEYGVFIGEDTYIGKGFGSEIARLMIQYAFEEEKLNKITLRVLAKNLRARKCYERAGFKKYCETIINIENVEEQVVFMEVNK